MPDIGSGSVPPNILIGTSGVAAEWRKLPLRALWSQWRLEEMSGVWRLEACTRPPYGIPGWPSRYGERRGVDPVDCRSPSWRAPARHLGGAVSEEGVSAGGRRSFFYRPSPLMDHCSLSSPSPLTGQFGDRGGR
ncbi:hypothetical protein NDU88_005734 [Pleurodeles waltl]|uniref:Uncharacterized protein n=1 Tax=Pleurodeles waltl TaxID=8319 RepID=A0AAV7LPY1_PLEWA|nr:hypothetical protein NDU88_005734 [Pleurodeles waltl]